jgi:hypothetical protein
MTKHWLFVSVPYTDFNKGSIHEMLEKITRSKTWPIGKRTGYRYELFEGDKILFYQGGEEGKKIVGAAVIASGLTKTKDSLCDYVMLREIEFWRKPVPIGKVLTKLSFVRDRARWGIYFRGGIVKISREDYMEILRHVRSLPY